MGFSLQLRQRGDLPHTVIPCMKWSDAVRLSVWFTTLQRSSRHGFQNPWRKGTLQVQNTVVKNWQCQNLPSCVQPSDVTEQRESFVGAGCCLSSSYEEGSFQDSFLLLTAKWVKIPQTFSNFYGTWYAPITPFSPWVILWNAMSLNIVGLFWYVYLTIVQLILLRD